MIQVCFDSPKAWAMLNYCRDHAMELHEPDQTWEELEDDYLQEAGDTECQENYVMTEDEMEKILKAVTRS